MNYRKAEKLCNEIFEIFERENMNLRERQDTLGMAQNYLWIELITLVTVDTLKEAIKMEKLEKGLKA